MLRNASARILAIALALWSLGCATETEPAGRSRIAVPPSMLGIFESYAPAGKVGLTFVGLRPYSRARDLEVLLFSSRSTAFQGVVVPGRYLPTLAPWLGTYPKGFLQGVREDVADSVGGDNPVALPLSLDFGVMVTRRDLWAEFGLPSPSTLAGLRDAMLTLRSRAQSLGDPIASDLPLDELFWDLGWSFEGEASNNIYTFPKVHALEFIQEFEVGRASRPGESLGDLLAKGKRAVAFTSLQRALAMCRKDRRLALSPLPAPSGRAIVIYNGWCLARPLGGAGDSGVLTMLEEEPFQEHLVRSGFVGARPSKDPPPAEEDFVLRRSEVHRAPSLGPGGDEVVLEALRDATETGMSAEEALRRGAARLERTRRER
jgi:hypothetical protein